MTDHDKNLPSEPEDVEQILEQQAKLESLMKEKFTKFVTIMFTDLKGSTSIAETEGDVVSRILMKEHNELVIPAIQQHNGVFVKSIGDGTLSYFDDALDAVRAAVMIQQGMDQLNMSQKFKTPILMRIGLHSGQCIVEKHDIFGDAVNTASRFESSANPGEVFMSEDTYNALSDKSEIYCRFIMKSELLRDMKGSYNVYKVFSNPREFEHDKIESNSLDSAFVGKPTSKYKLILIVLIPMLLVLALTLRDKIVDNIRSDVGSRSIFHSIKMPE